MVDAMKNLCAVLLLTSFAFGQQTEKKCMTLRECRTQIAALKDALQTEKDRSSHLADDYHRLAESTASVVSNAIKEKEEYAAKFENFKSAALTVLTQGNDLIKTLIQANNDLTNKYNQLLSDANSALATANARLARQNRVANALALYGIMPKYQPPATVNLNVTNCNALPALCVH